VSESNQKQPEPKQPRSTTRTSSNPLAGSALFSSADTVQDLPDLPEETETRPSTQRSTAAPTEPPAASLLYNTPAPPEYVLRPFEDRHDRQTIYIDARKAGALDALAKLVARGNKTDFFEEMVSDILAKYADVLQANSEMVRILEEKYRKKHNL